MSHRYLAGVFALGILLAGSVRAEVLVKGIARICSDGRQYPAPLDVYVFDAAKVPRLVNSLKMIDSGGPLNDQKSIERFDARFAALLRLVKSIKPLAHIMSDRSGAFSVGVPTVANLIIFGYAEREDYPFFWAHKEVVVSKERSVDVLLDVGNSCSAVRSPTTPKTGR